MISPRNLNRLPRLALAALPLLLATTALGQNVPSTQPTILARATKDSALYGPGETVTFQVTGARMSGVTGSYVVLKDGISKISEGLLPLEDNAPTTVTAKLDGPGWLLLKVSAKPQTGKPIEMLAGAVVAPRDIKPTHPVPSDFDAFWDEKVKGMSEVPINPRLEKVDVGGGQSVDYYRVKLGGYKGSTIHGQLARPQESAEGGARKKYPAVLVVQWAGVYPLQRDWVVGRAKQGFITLNILPHDAEFDLPKEEFDRLGKTTLKDYTAIGQTDRETSYFLRMFLSCYQAAQYLSTRDDWDGRTLIVTGTSQGGLQSIVTAALHPKVTHLIANVPAGCSVLTGYEELWWGWPYWRGHAAKPEVAADKDKILATAPYFDATNFAHRVKVPALVGLGLVDTTCPPPGVLAMINELKGPVEPVYMPAGTHQQHHEPYYPRQEAWFKAIAAGKPAPIDDGAP